MLHISERGRVVLLQETETGEKRVQKELRGWNPVYEQLKELSHPYLPTVYEVRREGDQTVVTEEHIEGASLAAVSLSQGQLTRLLLELCDVLEFLHGHGILHRDIKPSNLMLAADGHLRLIDFDAARREREEAEQDTRLLGTRGYAPPEQYGFAQTNARTDIYAMGVTFRQLLGPLARKRRWKKILRKCTALDPGDRYASAAQVSRAVWRGRAKRWLLRPILILFGLRVLFYIAILGYGFATNGEMRDAFHYLIFEMEWFERPRIFAGIDIEKMKTEETLARRYTGDASQYAQVAQAAYPEREIVYTGYLTTENCPLFGVFETEYDVNTGRHRYGEFLGLCAVWQNGEVSALITPQDCEAMPKLYGAPVLALYELDVFDTPIL